MYPGTKRALFATNTSRREDSGFDVIAWRTPRRRPKKEDGLLVRDCAGKCGIDVGSRLGIHPGDRSWTRLGDVDVRRRLRRLRASRSKQGVCNGKGPTLSHRRSLPAPCTTGDAQLSPQRNRLGQGQIVAQRRGRGVFNLRRVVPETYADGAIGVRLRNEPLGLGIGKIPP